MSGNIWEGTRWRKAGCAGQGDGGESDDCWHSRFPRNADVVDTFLENLTSLRVTDAAKIATQDCRRDMFEKVLALLEANTLTTTAIAAIDVEFGHQRFKVLPPLLKHVRPDLVETIDRAYIHSMCQREILKFHTLGLPHNWDAALQGFAEALETERELRQERGWRGKSEHLRIVTAANYVRGAAAFLRKLHELGVNDLRQYEQHHLDVFSNTSSNNYRVSAMRFIRWIKPKYGLVGRVVAPIRRLGDRRKPVLSQAQLKVLLSKIADGREPLPVRIAALLSCLYGQTMAGVTRLSLSDFDVQPEGMRVVFGSIPVALDSLTSKLLRQWLVERKQLLQERRQTSEVLFPSALGALSLEGSTLARAVIKAFGFSPIQLRTTALFNVVRAGGIRDVCQLTAYFGVSSGTARRVLTENGRLLFEATPEGAATLKALMRNEIDR